MTTRRFGRMVALPTMLTVLAATAACTMVGTVEERAIVRVFNSTSKNVTVKFKDCDDETNIYREVVKLYPKSWAEVPIDQPCVDAQAVDPQGNILGTQSRLKAPPEVTWHIY